LLLILCRDVFHCTPSALMDEPLIPVLQVLTAAGVEAEVLKQRAEWERQKQKTR